MITSGAVPAPLLHHHRRVTRRHAATHDFAEALATRTGLTPASDDEHEPTDHPVTRHLQFHWAHARSRLGHRSDQHGPPESFGQPEKHEECAVEPDHVGVRDAAEAIANVAPRHRGSIPVAAVGSTKIRVNGAQTGFAVSGQTVTEAVASKRSSWTITTGLGFPV